VKRINGPTGGVGVVVFDAALPLGELKAYVSKLGIVGPVARVKDGPHLGWGDGVFQRFAVPFVPSWGVVDGAGGLQVAKEDYPEEPCTRGG